MRLLLALALAGCNENPRYAPVDLAGGGTPNPCPRVGRAACLDGLRQASCLDALLGGCLPDGECEMDGSTLGGATLVTPYCFENGVSAQVSERRGTDEVGGTLHHADG